MFGDLMGNLEEQQAVMQEKLKQITVEETMEGIKITGNATKQITNISIAKDLTINYDSEMLEDLLLTCFNRYIIKVQKIEAEESQKLMQSILPPGFGDMFK
ncbi:MAG: YbaB/EbfC family nucleoid-associated protein [Saprospiraceae bacterium]|nr:YbaB/EbfC family nucleoid-associated protein [Saprospiraceae bacterium]